MANEVQIKITATDIAGKTIDSAANSVDKLGSKAGQVRGNISSLGSELLNVGRTGSVNFETLATTLAGLIPIAGGVATAIVAIGAAAYGAANQAAQWFKQVDDFSDITGVSTSVASELVTGMELAGASSQRMGMSLAMLNQRLDDEARSAEKAGSSTAKFGQQLARLEQDHSQRLADISGQLADRLSDLADQRLKLDRGTSEKLVEYEKDLARLRQQYDDDRLRRLRAINAELTSIDDDAAKERAAIESEFATANTALGKRALAAELAALDERTKKKRDKVTSDSQFAEQEAAADQARREQELAEQRQRDIDAYNERLAEFQKMQASIEAASQKAMDREAQQYERQVADINAAMTTAASAVATASNSTAAALERLGIKLDEFKDATPARQLQMIVDGLNGIGSANDTLVRDMEMRGAPKSMTDAMKQARGETDKARGAMELFGRYNAGEWLDYARLVETQGWGGLERAAKAYGTYIGSEFGQDAQKFIDSQNAINLAIKGAAVTIGTQAMPAFGDLSRILSAMASGNWAEAIEIAKNYTLWGFLLNNLQSAMYPGTLPGRASGGPVFAGQPYLVGERGPEVFVPQSSGSITNNYNYSPTYGNAPSNPRADFYLMQAMAGGQ